MMRCCIVLVRCTSCTAQGGFTVDGKTASRSLDQSVHQGQHDSATSCSVKTTSLQRDAMGRSRVGGSGAWGVFNWGRVMMMLLATVSRYIQLIYISHQVELLQVHIWKQRCLQWEAEVSWLESECQTWWPSSEERLCTTKRKKWRKKKILKLTRTDANKLPVKNLIV